MKKYLWFVPLTVIALAVLFARDELILSIKLILFSVVVGGMGGVVIGVLMWRERFLSLQAERKKLQRASEVMSIVAGEQVYISDMNHNAWWRTAHLDPRFYANSRDTYSQPLPEETRAWELLHAPKVVNHNQLLPASVEPDQPQTLFDLLNSYPHLMLVGGTGSGKTTAMNQAISYHLQQHPGAKVVWLSTHTNLDKQRGNVHSRAKCLQTAENIEKGLKDILSIYEQRRYGTGEYQYIIVAMDEWPELVEEVNDAGYVLRRLSRGTRKTNIRLILSSHGATVKDLDQAGHSSVKQDFAQVYLSPKLTARNKAIWQPFNVKSQVEIDLPGPFYANGAKVLELEPNRCICGEIVSNGRMYCSDACKQRAYRERQK